MRKPAVSWRLLLLAAGCALASALGLGLVALAGYLWVTCP